MVKLRPQKITLDIPEEWGEPWINIVVQRIERNGDIVNTVDRWDSFTFRLQDVADLEYPIPQSIDFDSGVFCTRSLGEAITTVALIWIADKYGGQLRPPGEVVIED